MKQLLLITLAFVSIAAKADHDFNPDEMVALGKVLTDDAVLAHKDLAALVVTGYQVGRITRLGQTFDGAVIFYNFTKPDGSPAKGEEVTRGMDRGKLPHPLLGWLVKSPQAGPFTQLEMLTVGKDVVDSSKSDSGGDGSHRVVTFKVFRSESDFPVVARVAWRHVAGGETKKGEFKYGCHKHDDKMECHREG